VHGIKHRIPLPETHNLNHSADTARPSKALYTVHIPKGKLLKPISQTKAQWTKQVSLSFTYFPLISFSVKSTAQVGWPTPVFPELFAMEEPLPMKTFIGQKTFIAGTAIQLLLNYCQENSSIFLSSFLIYLIFF
jgi:hypothetical protein